MNSVQGESSASEFEVWEMLTCRASLAMMREHPARHEALLAAERGLVSAPMRSVTWSRGANSRGSRGAVRDVLMNFCYVFSLSCADVV